MNYQYLNVTENDNVLTIELNRPDKLNALSNAVFSEFEDLLQALTNRTDSEICGVILTGAGERAFIAGADIAEMSLMSAEQSEAFSAQAHRITLMFEYLSVPVIACVNGYALGGGCEMALCCDFIYASENARFAQPEVSLGLIPGFGGCVRLMASVGPGYAREMIYRGHQIDAAEAMRCGLVNRVFENKKVMLDAAQESLKAIQANAAPAVASCKAVINRVRGTRIEEALACERRAFRNIFETEDMREGVAAFLDKRAASFTGR